MHLENTIIVALQKAITAAGSQSEFSRRSGVSQQCISNYLKHKTKVIDYDNWGKLAPILEPYLPLQRVKDARGDYNLPSPAESASVAPSVPVDGPHVAKTEAELRAILAKIGGPPIKIDSLEMAIMTHPQLTEKQRVEMFEPLTQVKHNLEMLGIQKVLIDKGNEVVKLLESHLRNQENLQEAFRKILLSKIGGDEKIALLKDILQIKGDEGK